MPRLDVVALYQTLDSERQQRKLSWRGVAREAGVSPSMLSRMAQGNRIDVDNFIALAQWLGMPAEQFIHGGASHRQATVPAQAIASLLWDKGLDIESAAAISDILRAAIRLAEKRRTCEA